MASRSTPLIDRMFLEIERKFFTNAGSRVRISANLGKPAFRNLIYLGQTTFEDIYFDRDRMLSTNGVWMRKRNGRWEAKSRVDGDYINSTFNELSERQDIEAVIQKYCSQADVASHNFGLQKIAQFTTIRDAWKADDRFKIVLDDTDFGHSVGEVELVAAIKTTSHDQSLEALQKSVTKKMHNDIDNFMKKYPWAFSVEEPLGKLSAYLAWKRGMADERAQKFPDF